MNATKVQAKKSISFSSHYEAAGVSRRVGAPRRRRLSRREARACELAGTLVPAEGLKDRIHLQKYELSSGARRWGSVADGAVLVCRRRASFGSHVAGSRDLVESLQREVLRGEGSPLSGYPSMPQSALMLLGKLFTWVFSRNVASGSDVVDLTVTATNDELMTILGCGRNMLDTFKTYSVSAGLVTVVNPVSGGVIWGRNTYVLNLSPTQETAEYLVGEMGWSRRRVEAFGDSIGVSNRMIADGCDPRVLGGASKTSWTDCARAMVSMRIDVCGETRAQDIQKLAEVAERRGAEEGLSPVQVARAYLHNIATNKSQKRLITPARFLSGRRRDGSPYKYDPLHLASRYAERFEAPERERVLAAYLAVPGESPDLPEGWYETIKAEAKVHTCGSQTAFGTGANDPARQGSPTVSEQVPSLRERLSAVLQSVAGEPCRPVAPGEFLDPADPSPITERECKMVAWLCHGYPASVGSEFYHYCCSRNWRNAGGNKVTRTNLSDKILSYARHGETARPSDPTAPMHVLVWPESREWDRSACPAAATAGEANAKALETAMGRAAKHGVRPVLVPVDWHEVHTRRNSVRAYTVDDVEASNLRTCG